MVKATWGVGVADNGGAFRPGWEAAKLALWLELSSVTTTLRDQIGTELTDGDQGLCDRSHSRRECVRA